MEGSISKWKPCIQIISPSWCIATIAFANSLHIAVYALHISSDSPSSNRVEVCRTVFESVGVTSQSSGVGVTRECDMIEVLALRARTLTTTDHKRYESQVEDLRTEHVMTSHDLRWGPNGIHPKLTKYLAIPYDLVDIVIIRANCVVRHVSIRPLNSHFHSSRCLGLEFPSSFWLICFWDDRITSSKIATFQVIIPFTWPCPLDSFRITRGRTRTTILPSFHSNKYHVFSAALFKTCRTESLARFLKLETATPHVSHFLLLIFDSTDLIFPGTLGLVDLWCFGRCKAQQHGEDVPSSSVSMESARWDLPDEVRRIRLFFFYLNWLCSFCHWN